MMYFRHSHKVVLAIQIAAVILLVHKATCYPKGAPVSACRTRLPFHEEINGTVYRPQTTPPPYKISVNASEFRAGDTLTVTIDTTEGIPFRGLIMQVWPLPSDSDLEFRNNPIGRFHRIVANTKPIRCHTALETETHTDAFAKYNLTMRWKAPLLIRNDVIVRATLVANFSTFWINVESPRIKIIPEENLPVEALEKPWLKEIIKTVSAEGDKKASRELVKARFEKGFQNLIEPHGYMMAHYVTELLPFEDSFQVITSNPTAKLPNVSATGPTINGSEHEVPKTSGNVTTGGVADNVTTGGTVENVTAVRTAVNVTTDGTAVNVTTDGTAVNVTTDGTAVNVTKDGTAVNVTSGGTVVNVTTYGTAVNFTTDGIVVNVTTDGTEINNHNDTALDSYEMKNDRSEKLRYMALVKTLLNGDISVKDELDPFTEEI